MDDKRKDPSEWTEWLDALEDLVRTQGQEQAQALIRRLAQALDQPGLARFSTDYRNTFTADLQPK